MVLTGAVVVFFGGLISDYFLQNTVGGVIGNLLSPLVPNWQNFWILEQLGLGKPVESVYFFMSSGHSLLMTGFYVTVAMMLFDRIEINFTGGANRATAVTSIGTSKGKDKSWINRIFDLFRCNFSIFTM